MNKKILFLLVTSIILGAGVFAYVKHQQSAEVDTSIAAVIVANSVTANPGVNCYDLYKSNGSWEFVRCLGCILVTDKGKPNSCPKCTCN